MMWTKIDARVFENRKVRRAIRRERLSLYLWWAVLVRCGAEGTDGLISADMAEDAAADIGLKPAEVERCVDALVGAGLWHTRDTVKACHCKVVGKRMDVDGWFVHDFADWNPTEDQALIPIEKLRWKRAQALKHDRALCEAIQERDGDRCCYCGCEVNWSDRRGPRGGTYDHLDPNRFEPNLGNALELIVVSCRKDNGEKKNRTPEEWVAAGGRPLLRDPRRSDGSRSRLGRDQVRPQSEPARTRSHGRAARETERVGSEPGPDLVATRTNSETPETGDDR